MTFPDWSAPLTHFKRKLDKMVCYLAEIEKDIGNLNLEVTGSSVLKVKIAQELQSVWGCYLPLTK